MPAAFQDNIRHNPDLLAGGNIGRIYLYVNLNRRLGIELNLIRCQSRSNQPWHEESQA
jgi:hypothetical protein